MLNINYIASWLPHLSLDFMYPELLESITWHFETLKLFNKKITVPRLVAFYGDESASYVYSGVKHQPLAWLPELHNLKNRLKEEYNLDFNSVLCNLYRDGLDYMGWHADNEKSLGNDPVIASISLGCARRFLLRHNQTREKKELCLAPGSLLIMGAGMQQEWQHCLPKMRRVKEARINLTFRKIISV